MSDQWYWVRSAQTRVDTAQVVQASNVASWAARTVEQAQVSILQAELWTSVVTPTSLDPFLALLMEEKQLLLQQCRDLLGEIQLQISVVLDDIEQHAEWLSMAALIYASADADAAAFFRHCEELSVAGCSSPRASGVLAQVLLGIPNLVKVMGPPQGGMPMQNAAVRTENQLRMIAAQMSSDGTSTANLASPLASLWLHAGSLLSPSPSGVVVVGEGKVAWGGVQGGGRFSQIASFAGADAALLASGTLVQLSPTAAKQEQTKGSSGLDGVWPEGWESARHPVRMTAALAGRSLARAPSCVPWQRPPATAATLLRSLENPPRVDGIGEIQILRHDQPGGEEPSWSVVIRGTQEWLPGSTNPQDLMSNFAEVSGKLSDQHVAVLAAMDLAGIQPGASLEFVGHSQGGAVALSVAASEQVKQKFNVVSVLTAGGPVGSVPGPEVRVLALENTADIVPSLDGKPSSTVGNHVVVHFDRSGLDPVPAVGAHGMPTYAAAAEQLSELSKSDPDLASFREWEEARVEALRLGEGTTTTSQVYATRRTLGPVNLPDGWAGGSHLGKLSYQRAS